MNSSEEGTFSESLQSFQSVSHAVQEIDNSGKLIFSNPAHCRMHGYQPGELVGRTIWELLASEREQEAFRHALEDRLRNAPPPLAYSSRHRRKDGGIIEVQVDWTYKRDRQGDVEGFIAIISDITQQVRERREYQMAHEQAASRESQLSAQLRLVDAAFVRGMDFLLSYSGRGKNAQAGGQFKCPF